MTGPKVLPPRFGVDFGVASSLLLFAAGVDGGVFLRLALCFWWGVWEEAFSGSLQRYKGPGTRFRAGTLAMNASGDVAGDSEGVKLSVKIRILNL